jgi:hypothetical protein
MNRYLIAAVMGCLYVAGSTLIVQSEGRAYRSSLINREIPARANDAKSSITAAQSGESSPAVNAATISTPRTEPAITKPAAAISVSERPAIDSGAPAPPPTEVAKASPATPSLSKKPAAPDAPAKASLAHPLETDPFWNQPQLRFAWDVAHLKLEDERRLRDQLHQLIVRFNPLVPDPGPWISRVEDAADPFRKMLHRKDIKYQYFILDSDVVNAFSIPGGNVYISRGLFDLIGEDEDYALQFAVGHEIAHVDDEHALKCLRDPDVMKMTEGTLQKLFMLILPFGYLASDTVDQEFQADEWVAQRMQRIGRTRRETLVFLQKLEGYSKTHQFSEGRVQPQPGRGLSPLENHYRAQTAPRKRLKHLKEFIDQAAKASK